MATTPTPAQFRAVPSVLRVVPNIISQAKQPLTVKCALSRQNGRQSRRLVSVSLILLHCLRVPKHAFAGSIFDKYVKRKKLDPLDAYVPVVILTQLQIKDIERTLEADGPQYDTCRSLLRSGPAASLRVNIRAVAQYAADNGNGKTAFNNVDQCLSWVAKQGNETLMLTYFERALEELDSLFLRASRNDPGASVESMKAKIIVAIDALDSLLGTVPSDVLDKGKAIADSYRNSKDDADLEPENLDPEIKKLESIL